MKRLLLIAACLPSFNSFAESDCSYENRSSIELSKEMRASLGAKGCGDGESLVPAKNHLVIEVTRIRLDDNTSFQALRGNEMLGTGFVHNLANGRVISFRKWYPLKKKFMVAREEALTLEEWETQADYVAARVQKDLAKLIKSENLFE